jgi:hypothetical protein
LVDAIHAGRPNTLGGFGPKTAENILHGVEIRQDSQGRPGAPGRGHGRRRADRRAAGSQFTVLWLAAL